MRFDQLWPWLPYPAVLLIAGIVTGAIGTLIGLPALRLSGLYLALITLMAAAAITVLLKVQQFPNGGGGFWGVKQGSRHLRDQSAVDRARRHRVLPLLRVRRDPHVPASRSGT